MPSAASGAVETILIFAANPGDSEPLRLDLEVREIANALRHSQKPFEVRQQWATRPTDLRRALLDHRPSIVHFCGHGAGSDGIVLEGQLVEGAALAELFRIFAKSVECVVLNACFSHIQAREIAKHVRYVVGMKREIGDAAAIEFSTAFYDAVGAGESIEFAFDLACNAIQLAGLPEHLTPALLTETAVTGGCAPPSAEQHSVRFRDWDGAPAVSLLYGREAVAELLRSWILDDLCRVVLITGMGGIGKTDLATCLGRGGNRSAATSETLAAGIQGHFDSVLWRSLLNAPRPEEIFADVLGVLSPRRGPPPSASTQQLDELLSCLRDRRCMIILDNVETVLKPGDPSMRYREGYERYGTFFELVAKTDHQSCLLLTSREKPGEIASLEGARKPVRSLALAGISATESRDLFGQISTFSGRDDQWNEVARLYGGNPLALELAARHIDQVFGGDLQEFLSAGRHVFGDLEGLLDWHLERLTEAEIELLYWLAIEREPVTLAVLVADLVSPVSRERVASTVQGLQRRIPLERVDARRFGLQPVLIERVTARLVGCVGAAVTAAASELRQTRSSAAPARETELLRLLDSYALVKATAREHVRESQQLLILDPIAEHIKTSRLGRDVRTFLVSLLDLCRENSSPRGYAPGNVINLLQHLGLDLHGLDFSRLPIRQARLRDVSLHATDFSYAHFHQSTTRHGFGTPFAVAYSPDGSWIAVGDENGEVRILSAPGGQLRVRMVGHSDGVFAVAFRGDGRTLASSGFDGAIRVWDVEDGRCVDVLLGHVGWVYSLAFSPDGRTLASAGEDGTCRLWSLEDGTAATIAQEDNGFLAAVAFSPEGRSLAAAGSRGDVIVIRPFEPDRPMRLLGHSARIRSLAFSGQGDLLASGSEDGEIIVWRPADGVRLATLRGHTGSVTSLSFAASGDVLASGSADHSIRLWSTVRMECLGQLQGADGRVWSVACSPAERSVAGASEDGTVRVWSIDTRQRLLTLRGYSNKTLSLSFPAEGDDLVAGTEDGSVRVWNTEKGEPRRTLQGHTGRVWAVACSPDGRWVASASDDLTIRLWDSRSRTSRWIRRGHADWIRTLCFDGESRRLVSGGEDGWIRVWDVETGELVWETEAHVSRVFSAAFGAIPGGCVAAGGSGPDIGLFRASDGRELQQLSGHMGWINAVVPLDSMRLGSCSDDGTLRLWDLATGTCSRSIAAGTKVLCAVACEAGGRSILTGTEDGVLRRWRALSGDCEATARAHHGSIWSLAVDAANSTVATAGNDGAIRLWRLPDLAPRAGHNTLRSPRPYEGMNISGATGLTDGERRALIALGAIEMPSR